MENDLLPLLRRHSIAPWYSTDDIPSAAVWERCIRDGLNSCEWFLVVLSPSAVASEWVQAEVHWAMEHRRGRIVPVLIYDCDPSQLHLQLMRYQYVDFRQDREEAGARLLSVWGVAYDDLIRMELTICVSLEAALSIWSVFSRSSVVMANALSSSGSRQGEDSLGALKEPPRLRK